MALSTLAIALHTFFVIFFRWTPPPTRVLGIAVAGTIWMFISLLVLLSVLAHSNGPEPFYTPSPLWCYISASHPALRVGANYAYAWLAALVSMILYWMLWLRLRGRVVGQWEGGRIRVQFLRLRDDGIGHESGDGRRIFGGEGEGEGTVARDRDQREARKMLWYPLCYIIVILPFSATRWSSFSAHSAHQVDTTPLALTTITASLFKLSGLADVLLFTITRPNVLLLGSSRSNSLPHPSTRVSDAETTTRGSRRRNETDRLPHALLTRLVRLWVNRRRLGRRDEGEVELRHIALRRTISATDDDGRQPIRRSTSTQIDEQLSSLPVLDIRSRETIGSAHASLSFGEPSYYFSPTITGSSADRVNAIRTKERGGVVQSNARGEARAPTVLDLDLSQEIDLHPRLISPLDTGVSFTQLPMSPPLLRTTTPGRRDGFFPLTLDLPSPRVGSVYEAWVDMQREERFSGSLSGFKEGNTFLEGPQLEHARPADNSGNIPVAVPKMGAMWGKDVTNRNRSELNVEGVVLADAGQGTESSLTLSLGQGQFARQWRAQHDSDFHAMDSTPRRQIMGSPTSLVQASVPIVDDRADAGPNEPLSATDVQSKVHDSGPVTRLRSLDHIHQLQRKQGENFFSISAPSQDQPLSIQRHPRGPRPSPSRGRARSSSDPLPSSRPRSRTTLQAIVTSALPSATSTPSGPSDFTPRSAHTRTMLSSIPEHTVLRELSPSPRASPETVFRRHRSLPRTSRIKRGKRGDYTSFIEVSARGKFA
ncbi:hypothetical protein M0805_001232 [Coniferiporia weirii]|nr:hypothetical protein M0805_001232 [Coniferiporia weirii]